PGPWGASLLKRRSWVCRDGGGVSADGRGRAPRGSRCGPLVLKGPRRTRARIGSAAKQYKPKLAGRPGRHFSASGVNFTSVNGAMVMTYTDPSAAAQTPIGCHGVSVPSFAL